MSYAQLIHDIAPLGSLIRFSDGTPKPPSRFSKKLASWENRNGVGRLVSKKSHQQRDSLVSPASFTLHLSNMTSGSVTIITFMRTFAVDSLLNFEVIERPAIGMIRIIQNNGNGGELLYLAENREAAELWLANKRHWNTRLEEVTTTVAGATEREVA